MEAKQTAAPLRRLQDIRALRAEARLLLTAGLILLSVGLPLTLFLAACALSPSGLSPWAPVLSGGPLVAFGWAACRYASWRFEQAQRMEQRLSGGAPRL